MGSLAFGSFARGICSTAIGNSAFAPGEQATAGLPGGRVATLEGDVGLLFDLSDTLEKDLRQSIAATTALAQPHFPSEDGATSYASNLAYFRGEIGFSAGLAHRFNRSFALTSGVSYGGGDNLAVKAGVAGEF